MKLQYKIESKLNEGIRTVLKDAFYKKFKIRVDTIYNLFSGQIVTKRINGKPFTKEQLQFVKTFELGYIAAWDIVKAS